MSEAIDKIQNGICHLDRDERKEAYDSFIAAIALLEKEPDLEAENERLKRQAQLVTPDQNEMRILRDKVDFLKLTESQRNKKLQDENKAILRRAVSAEEDLQEAEAENERLREVVKIDVQVFDDIKNQYPRTLDLQAKIDWRDKKANETLNKAADQTTEPGAN